MNGGLKSHADMKIKKMKTYQDSRHKTPLDFKYWKYCKFICRFYTSSVRAGLHLLRLISKWSVLPNSQLALPETQNACIFFGQRKYLVPDIITWFKNTYAQSSFPCVCFRVGSFSPLWFSNCDVNFFRQYGSGLLYFFSSVEVNFFRFQ